MPILHKDMSLCISLSARPSNLGTRFHNYLYDELGLPFVYKAFATDDLEGAIRGVRALGIRGCSISMPFKESVIAYLDTLEHSAAAIDAVNTIVNDDGRLVGANTDYEAVATLLAARAVDPTLAVVVRGSGGMAKAVVAAFRGAGFDDLTVLARNEEAGRALASRYGYAWTDVEPRPGAAQVLVNVTPLGMDGPYADASAFTDDVVDAAQVVFDLVAFPAHTPLLAAAERSGRTVLRGTEVITLQAARQFERYTGVLPSVDQVQRAGEFSRRPA